MRKVIALYTKKEKLQLLNQSLSQIVVNAVNNNNNNNIVNKDKENYPEDCIGIIKSVVPEATDVTVNPIKFRVKTLDGVITVTFKDGSFVEV